MSDSRPPLQHSENRNSSHSALLEIKEFMPYQRRRKMRDILRRQEIKVQHRKNMQKMIHWIGFKEKVIVKRKYMTALILIL